MRVLQEGRKVNEINVADPSGRGVEVLADKLDGHQGDGGMQLKTYFHAKFLLTINIAVG